VPLYATLLRTVLFVVLGALFYRQTGVVGIAVIDSVTVAIEAGFLLILLWPILVKKIDIVHTTLRSLAGSIVAVGIIWAILTYLAVPWLAQVTIGLIAAAAVYVFFVIKEVRLLVRL